jgi:rhodanese-related sulfurtransferase/glyoxylase-like metal-dependent hydrolase (beta-lactamase superfamily II)
VSTTGSTQTARVHLLHDDALANTSHLVEVGDGDAVVIDPPRDIDRHLRLASELAVEVVATFETHVHADYVSGAIELAALGVEAIVPEGAQPAWPHRSIGDDEVYEVGRARLRALATPGHTPEHVSYVLEIAGEPVGAFTGGSLIIGGAARTDLLGSQRTDELARAQHASLRRLARLPDATPLYPTHGAGSFCHASAVTVEHPTIGSERETNALFSIEDEDEFVAALTGGFGSYPRYYAHLPSLNETGPTPIAALREPGPLDPRKVAHRIEAGDAWLIDARDISDWARAHPRGAVSNALRPAFASWLGWVVPFGAPVIALVDPDGEDELVRLARRIGYDDISFLEGGIESWRAAGLAVDVVTEVGAVAARELHDDGATLLDVRQSSEHKVLRIPNAVHLELGDIIAGAVPDGPGPFVVLCGHGERSATAASLLERRGLEVVNLVGGTSAWVEAGLPVES